MRVIKTNRGFQCIQFTDLYGKKCSLQQSSLATEEAIRFGPDFDSPHERMHLSRSMTQELVEHLQSWLQSGSLDPEDKGCGCGSCNLCDLNEALEEARKFKQARKGE